MPKHLRATFILAALLALCCIRPGFAAADAGQVLTFNGDCFVVVGDQRTALKMGDTVHVGDVLDVPDGAKLKLRMNDGSILALGSGSRLTIQGYDVDTAGNKRNAKLGLDPGVLHAIVAQANQPSTFEVDTATGVAAARSTDWFVETDPSKTRVGVLDGSVNFAARDAKGNPAAGGVVIPANSGSEIDVPAAPPEPAETKPGAPKHAAAPPPKLVPTPVKPWAKAAFDALLDRTSVTFGWCQCIADTTGIRGTCESSSDGCKSTCGGGKFSFVPNAHLSCARFYADGPAGPAKQP